MAEAEDTTDDMTVSYHSDAGEPVPSTPQRKSFGVASQQATGARSDPSESFDEAELLAMGSVLYEVPLTLLALQSAQPTCIIGSSCHVAICLNTSSHLYLSPGTHCTLCATSPAAR